MQFKLQAKTHLFKLEGAQRVHTSVKWRLDWVRTDTQTDKSENSISASFTPFTWRI